MISEERLRQAATVAGRAFADSLPAPESCHHDFSPEFERKMRRVLRRGNHPVIYRSLRRVAGFFLAVLVSGFVWLSVDAEAREAFFRWVSEWTTGAYHYYIPETEANGAITVKYIVPDAPDDYDLYFFEQNDIGITSYIFMDDSGSFFKFKYSFDANSELYILRNTNERFAATVSGNPAWFYPAESEDDTNTLAWTDRQTGALLSVSGYFDKDFLIHWAEKLQIEKS